MLQRLADDVVAMVRDVEGDAEANVTVSRGRHGLTRFANSFVHQHVTEDTTTVALTLAIDGRTATASTTDTGSEALRALVERTATSARVQPVDPTWPGATPPAAIDATGNRDEPTAAATPDDRAQLVKTFVDAGPGLRAAGFVDTAATDTAFASTAGQRASGSATRATIDGIHQTDHSAGSAHATSVRLRDLDAEVAGERAADPGRPRPRRLRGGVASRGGGDAGHLPRRLRLQRQVPPPRCVVRGAG
jgi:predicted Zn-dependent protease